MAPERNPRVFVDSNVVVSGVYAKSGAPAEILDAFGEGHLNLILSRQVVEEVIGTVRRKIPRALPALRDFLFAATLEVVPDPSHDQAERWVGRLQSGDAAILAAAMAAGVDYFVTGDRDFLNDAAIATDSGLRILTPSQFVELLRRDYPGVAP